MPEAAPLSVLHVVLTQDYSGAERHAVDLARLQIERGYKIGFVAYPPISGQDSAIGDHLPDGARLFLAKPGFARFTIMKAAKAIGADLLHAHSGRANIEARGAFFRPPVIATLHLFYKQKSFRGLDGMIHVAHWQERLTGDFSAPKTTVQNWVTPVRTPSEAERAAARARLGAGPDDPVIGFMGRISQQKGADLVVEAFRRAAPQNARLALVGYGPILEELKQRTAGDPRVHLVGYSDDPGLWLHSFDLFVMGSRSGEPFPLVLLEAMGAARPIISTASDGPSEILNGQPARLVPMDDVEAMAGALGDWFAKGPRAPVPYDVSPFTPERGVKQVEDFYRLVLAHKGRARA